MKYEIEIQETQIIRKLKWNVYEYLKNEINKSLKDRDIKKKYAVCGAINMAFCLEIISFDMAVKLEEQLGFIH